MNDVNTYLAIEALKSAAEGVGKESVNKIADAMGAIFPFFGLEKEAVKTYVEDIKNSNMPPEAKLLAIANVKRTYKDLINQSKIMKIAVESAKEGTDFSESSKVDNDWLARFMDSAKFVSNDEMQFVWGRILAGEFESPGSTPPQIIRVLSEITPKYAQIFTSLCNLSPTITKKIEGKSDKINLIIIDYEDDFLKSLSLSINTLHELKNYGLIEFHPNTEYSTTILKEEGQKLYLEYGNKFATLDYPDTDFPIGHVYLTEVGECIFNIIEKSIIEGYWERLIYFLKRAGVVISEEIPI